MRRGFVESTATGFAHALTRAMMSEETARRRGLVQALDPRVRVVGLLSLVIAVTLCRRLSAVAALFALAVALALLSKVDLMTLAKRVWLVVLAFTGVIALPAIFITAGNPVGAVGGLRITSKASGCRPAGAAGRSRGDIHHHSGAVHAVAAGTKGAALVTPAAEAVAMLAMTYRYVFLLVETATQMFESRQQPYGWRSARPRAAEDGGAHRRSAAKQERATERRGVSGDAVARIPRRRSSALRLPHDNRGTTRLLQFWAGGLAVWKGR